MHEVAAAADATQPDSSHRAAGRSGHAAPRLRVVGEPARAGGGSWRPARATQRRPRRVPSVRRQPWPALVQVHESAGEQRIAAAFAAARRSGRRAALMPFLMGGFPTLQTSREIGWAYADNGADIVEIGIPYADPIADGPVNQAAGAAALRAGATVEGVLDVVRAVSERVAVVVMCYAGTVLERGIERFADDVREAGASGLIVPDLPADAAADLLAACDAAGLCLVPLVSPATPAARAAGLCASARGFVYAMSVAGATGERSSLAGGVAALIAGTRARSAAPVALGFGISTPEHAAQAADAGAEGVVVGSRLVRAAAEAADPVATTGALVAAFAAALAAPRADAWTRRDIDAHTHLAIAA